MNFEKLPQLAPDKANHYVYGSLIAVAGALAGMVTGIHPGLCAIGAAVAAGVLKEVWDDRTGLGDPDMKDAIATAFGGIPVAIAASIGASL